MVLCHSWHFCVCLASQSGFLAFLFTSVFGGFGVILVVLVSVTVLVVFGVGDGLVVLGSGER